MNKFKYKKSYGQVFLKDQNIINKIIEALNAQQEDLVIEIGAGTGVLTEKIKELNTNLLVYEIDLETKSYLDKLGIKVIYDDFLKRNIEEDIRTIKYKDLYIVGNLPYYITTRIIRKITLEKIPTEMIFMVQKEVAQRLSAKPGNKEYGFITVYLNYYYDIETLFIVNKNAFYPLPKVNSAVIKLKPHKKYDRIYEKKFVQLAKDSFRHKRKTLLNNLKNYDRSIVEEVLIQNKVKTDVRAEELSINIFLEITKKLLWELEKCCFL